MIGAVSGYERHPGVVADPEVLAAVDQTEAELAELTGVLNATNARITRLVAGLLHNGGWCQGGICSPEHYLSWKMGISTSKARQYVQTATRIDALPECADAYEHGELSIDQAATVAAHAPAWTDHRTCGFATTMTLRQLRHVLTRYVFEDAPAVSAEPEPERRQVRFATDSRGRWRLNAELPADEGAFVEQALRACRDDLFHQRHPAAGDDTSPIGEDRHSATDISWADALTEAAERALASGAAARPHSDRYRVLFHHHHDASGSAALITHHSDVQLPDALRRYWTCDAAVVPVSHLGGVPVNVGRTQRIVPDRTRRLVEHRDGGCVIPDCPARHHLVIHHVTHWADGGPTDTANLVALCARHHRELHHGLLHLIGSADRAQDLRVTDHRGRAIVSGAETRSPDLPPAEAAHAIGLHVGTWRHPLGERLRYDDVTYGPPPRAPD